MPLPPTIPQNYARTELEPYVIAGFLPQLRPLVACFSSSDSFVGTPDITDALADALTVDMGAYCRWIADPAKLTDHGDGTWRWATSQGNATPYWEFPAANVCVSDPTWDYKRRNGHAVVKPAFIFKGDMWAKLHGFPDALEGCTVLIVARLRDTNGAAIAGIAESQISGADPAAQSDIYFRLRGDDYVRSVVRGHKVTDHFRRTRRPQIVGASHHTNQSHQVIVDADRNIKSFHHPQVDSYDMTWYLARTGGGYDADKTLVADVLDISMWDTALTRNQLGHKAHLLNGIYAVTG